MDFDTEMNKIPFKGQEIDMEQLYRFAGALDKSPQKRKAIPAIFRFFETHSDKDLGSPGPLVHFLEEESDYHIELEQSVLRKPTVLTVWMINRLMNAVPPTVREHWLTILTEVVEHPNADVETIESAKDFIAYQSK
ncbi:hypothetical protein [Reinekea sp. G2M2-21]|uniref:hypothetical protein n=1 Tax=Reinekea sp. G2M2-21 TaxID=2788942 RepID=UPI0018AA5350|nr:hypothetical protein [Reinekea sp. G2M2-21]